MRLWHHKLIPYLPNSQLLAQWRELNSIFKKQDKHILINYVYEYPKIHLCKYADMVINEMTKRQITITSFENYDNYFEASINTNDISDPFPNHHNNRYLLQCFYNLQEKYDRGQKDFTEEQMHKMQDLVKYL